jgi:hypothetical protein
MATIKIDPAAVAEAKAFYQEELQKTLSRLNHIQHMLAELGDSTISLELKSTGTSPSIRKTVGRPASSATKKRKAKPGPKSKWDKIVLKVLKEEQKPFSYDELTLALMIASGRSVSERARTKATVQNTVFKLRNSSKVKTFSKGGRDKYVALSEWFDGETIKEEYANKVPDHEKKTPKKVSSGRGPGRPRKVVVEGAVPAKKTAKKPASKAKKPAPKKTVAKKVTAAKKPVAAKKTAAAKKTVAAKKTAVAKKAPSAKKTSVGEKTTKVTTPKSTPTKKKSTVPSATSQEVKEVSTSPAIVKKEKSVVKKKATPKKAVKKSTPTKKTAGSAVKKVAVRKTPDRGLSQVKGVKLPDPKK